MSTAPPRSLEDFFRVESEYRGRGAPVKQADIARWLLVEGPGIGEIDELFDELCWRIVGGGVPLWRATLHIGTLHPQIRGFGVRWWRERGVTERFRVAHGAETTAEYRNSPIRTVVEDGAVLRRRLVGQPTEFPLLEQLRRQGATDYLAAPLSRILNRHPAVTWSTDRPGGFGNGDLSLLTDLAPALSAIVETRAVRRTARNLLDTYLGRQVGQRILDGQILRGDGELIRAVILATDLRGFTTLSDRLPGESVIGLLDDYFEQIADPVQRNAGEVLKFIGDGALAIFPVDGSEAAAARTGLTAAVEILDRLARANEARRALGQPALRTGLGLHLGDVLYGNVGSTDRLDFTVIGPAVNLAFRLESLTKRLDRPLVVSAPFASVCPVPLVSLGFHPLRGLARPHEVFGLPPGGETVVAG